jgi:uncharacterized membrane protein
MLQHILLDTAAVPILAMAAAGIIGNRLFDRGVRFTVATFVATLFICALSLVGVVATFNGFPKWMLIASLSVTFACIALIFTIGRDETGTSDEHAN